MKRAFHCRYSLGVKGSRYNDFVIAIGRNQPQQEPLPSIWIGGHGTVP